MPTSVTSTAGTSFHLWQLPDESSPEPEDSIEYTTIKNEMSEGHRSSALLGLNTGLRTFKLNIPTASSYVSRSGFSATLYTPTATGVSGVSCTREQYIRTLYALNKTGGVPFVYQYPPTTGQYYLVDIVDDSLEMSKVKGANIYSTSLTMKQRRIQGETVFSLFNYGFYSPFDCILSNEDGHFTPNWVNELDGSNYWNAPAGGITFSGNAQNGHNTLRFNGSSGYLSGTGASAVSDIIIAMKVNSATFSGAGGLFSTGAADVIKGTASGTKWQNPSLTGFEYKLNNTSYAVTDMQAPMNAFGICHFRATEAAPMVLSAFNIGKTFGGVYLSCDIGEIFVATDQISKRDVNYIVEHLATKWGVTL